MKTYGERVDISADELALDELACTAGHVLWLRHKVQAEDAEALVWGTIDETTTVDGDVSDTTVDSDTAEFPVGRKTRRGARPSIWLELYMRERRHLLEILKTMKTLEIDAKRLEFARAQVAPQIMLVIEAFTTKLQLTVEQQRAAPELLRGVIMEFLAQSNAGHRGAIEGSVVEP